MQNPEISFRTPLPKNIHVCYLHIIYIYITLNVHVQNCKQSQILIAIIEIKQTIPCIHKLHRFHL